MRIFGALDAFAGSSRPGVRNRGAGGRAPSDLSGEASSPLSGLPAAPGGLGLPPAGAAPPPPPLRLRVAAVPARLRVRAVPRVRVRVRLRPSVFFLQGHGSHRFKGRSTSVRLPLNQYLQRPRCRIMGSCI